MRIAVNLFRFCYRGFDRGRILVLGLAAERVIGRATRLDQRIGGVVDVRPDLVAGGVERVDRAIAERVGCRGQTIRLIVNARREGAVRIDDLGPIAGGVIGVDLAYDAREAATPLWSGLFKIVGPDRRLGPKGFDLGAGFRRIVWRYGHIGILL